MEVDKKTRGVVHLQEVLNKRKNDKLDAALRRAGVLGICSLIEEQDGELTREQAFGIKKWLEFDFRLGGEE